MKLRSIWVLPSHAAMLGFSIVFLTCWDLFLESQGSWPLPILAVNLCLIVLLALTSGTLIKAAGSQSTRERIVGLYRAHASVLIALAAVVAASFISSFSRTAYLDEGPRYVLYPAYGAASIVVSMLLPLPEHRRHRFRWYLFAAFAVAVAAVMVDVVMPGTFSMLPDRAAGFPRNPNGGGFLVIALGCAVLSFERVRVLDLVALTAMTGAVVATLSRGAMVLLVFVIGCYATCIVLQARRRGFGAVLRRLGGLVLLVGIIGSAIAILISQRMFAAPGSRLEMLTGQEQLLGQRESRVELLEYSWDLVRASPVFGYGSGFTSTMKPGPHNIYISRWLDDGLLGVLCYVWLLAALFLTFLRRRYIPGLVFTAVLVIEGVFNHNMLEERVFLLLPGILLALSFLEIAEPVTAMESRRWTPGTVSPRGVRTAVPPNVSA